MGKLKKRTQSYIFLTITICMIIGVGVMVTLLGIKISNNNELRKLRDEIINREEELNKKDEKFNDPDYFNVYTSDEYQVHDDNIIIKFK